MPSDVTGVSRLRPADRQFEFRPGPIFANILLADEINRASPKTQSALLEAWRSGRSLSTASPTRWTRPFLVMATQNPVEMEGTYPLPEAQLDRFLARPRSAIPDRRAEVAMLAEQSVEDPLDAAAGDGRRHDAAADQRHLPDPHRAGTAALHRGDWSPRPGSCRTCDSAPRRAPRCTWPGRPRPAPRSTAAASSSPTTRPDGHSGAVPPHPADGRGARRPAVRGRHRWRPAAHPGPGAAGMADGQLAATAGRAPRSRAARPAAPPRRSDTAA